MNDWKILLVLFLATINFSCVNSIETFTIDYEIVHADSIDKKDLIGDLSDTATVNPDFPPENYTSDQIDSLGIELMSKSNIGGVEIGMTQDEVIAVIGEPEVVSIPEEWDVDGGVHTFWYYSDSSFVLEFVHYSSQETNAVEIIEMRDSCELYTNRGITIGSHLDLVKTRYTEAIEISNWEEEQEKILLGNVGIGGLFFTICGNVICNIRFGAIIRC